MIFEQHIKSLRQFEQEKNKVLNEIIKDYEPEIIDMNLAQLDQGEEATGDKIEPAYRPITIELKKITGQPTDRVTLKDTGDFHNDFFLTYGRDWFNINSNDEKADKLERKYGKDIYGLSDNHIQDLINQVKPDFQQQFKKAIIG